MSNFHVSLPCKSVTDTKQFYVNLLGLNSGRESYNWIDIDLFGNQITFAEHNNFSISTLYYNVDNKKIPIFHLGIILEKEDWKRYYSIYKNQDFFVLDATRFMYNKVGEHESFFIKDPNGYYIEFKCFKNSIEKFNK